LKAKIVSLVPADYGQRVGRFIADYQQVADQLRSLIYRTMCPMLIDQASVSKACMSICTHRFSVLIPLSVVCCLLPVVCRLWRDQLMNQLVEQSGWEQKKMREEPHEWVDVLVNLCTEGGGGEGTTCTQRLQHQSSSSISSSCISSGSRCVLCVMLQFVEYV
jgi:hypothetical protein